VAAYLPVQLDPRAEAGIAQIAFSIQSLVATSKEISTTLKVLLPAPAKQIRLALPSITRKGVLMANFELANDEVATIPILVDDAGGAPVPAPAGDVFSVVSSNPASLGATIGTTAAGTPAVVLTPLVQASPNLSIVVSDSAGLSSFTLGIDIVADTTPKAITLDLTKVTEATQPVPTATGP